MQRSVVPASNSLHPRAVPGTPTPIRLLFICQEVRSNHFWIGDLYVAELLANCDCPFPVEGEADGASR